jgi:signal-transduction protein with cAMP-binding, CBS, and nucleotidyltransferase domain
MLNDTWKRVTELSEISSQAGMETPKVEVSTTETLSELANAMFNSNASSILITQNAKPIGIINERDLLKEIIENRRDPKKTLTGDLAFTPLVSLDGGNSITDILSSMREKGMKRAAVIKNGQLVGMLTEDLGRGSKVKPGKTGT